MHDMLQISSNVYPLLNSMKSLGIQGQLANDRVGYDVLQIPLL